MRTTISFIVVAICLATAVSAQPRGALVMYVGPAPQHLMSVGLAVPEHDRLIIRARIEFALDCTPAGVEAVDATDDQVYVMREIGAGETPEAYGEMHAGAYGEAVAARGGATTPEYVECVRRVMAQRAERQLERR